MNGFPFWEYTLSGLVVSLPTVIVTVWVSHRSLRSHIDKRTDAQTGDIKGITDAQTNILLSKRRAAMWRRWRWMA